MAETVILAEQELSFVDSGVAGLYLWQVVPSVVTLTEGETYIVEWNGERHNCIATYANFNGVDGIGLGNFALAGLGENNNMSFLFGAAVDGSFSACYTTESNATNMFAIYQEAADEEPEEEPKEEEHIVLKDRNGKDIIFQGVEKISLKTTSGGTQIFSKGEAIDGIEIPLYMPDGDQIITAPDGMMVRSATIQKPETLTPDNIRKGINVAGVTGEYGVDTEETTVALEMADGDMVVSPAEGKAFSKVTVTKPEELTPENVRNGTEIGGVTGSFIGDTEEKTVELSFDDGDQVVTPSEDGKVISEVTIIKPDTLTPENIAKDVEIAGVVGTHEGGGSFIDFTDENLQYFTYQIDEKNRQIILCTIMYEAIYEKTGSYDVTIPDTIGGLPVVIRSD